MTRVRLVPLTMSDVEAILGRRSDHAPWANGYPTEGDLEVATWLRDGKVGFPSVTSPWVSRVVVEAETGLAIGGIGFHTAPDPDGSVEIGYGIADSFRGRGLATESVATILAIADIAGARTVVAGTDGDNPASARVLEKNGFVRAPNEGDEIRWRWTPP